MSQPPAVPEPLDTPDVDVLAAALRADSGDLTIYSRVLFNALADALPAGMVKVEHDQSLRDRIAGRPGAVRSLRITLGDNAFELSAGKSGVPVGRCQRAVRGVVISSKEVSLEEWTRLLATELSVHATESAAARHALARLLGAE